jgi:hypothetical protein
MDFSRRFDRWFNRLPASPKDEGRLVGLVLRPAEGTRKIVEVAEVSPELGMHGDRWSVDSERTGQDQISLINIHVISSLAKGPEQCALSGDNLHVDLDLSEANLPVASQLEIGSAVLEISPQQHQPCGKFLERFGKTAVKRVLRANRRGRRGRGVICMVIQAGEMQVGDTIRIKRPKSAPL